MTFRHVGGRIRRYSLVALLVGAVVLGFGSSAAFARGGGGGGGGGGTTPSAAPCAKATVTNTGQTVRHQVMPDLKYNLENCSAGAETVTVTVTEAPGFLSVSCPSPVAAPAVFTLNAGQKLSPTFPVYRGPCGHRSPSDQTIVQGINAWQGHNLLLTVTDTASGTVLATSTWFSWQDVYNPGV